MGSGAGAPYAGATPLLDSPLDELLAPELLLPPELLLMPEVPLLLVGEPEVHPATASVVVNA